ncbi:MAG: RtcB family protein [Acidobacteriota bacterium]|nr:RtcB family protein [Acidobacteriota bacterium]
MQEIVGKYNTAKVFTDKCDDFSLQQVKTLCDQAFTAGSKIRLMPDVHAGAGCTIGTTMTISDKVVPNMVGVDIGCGMETLVVPAESEFAAGFDPAKLDALVRERIPCGREVRDTPHPLIEQAGLDAIRCPAIQKGRARKSLGTLGGGNHFIEADRDEDGNLYLVVHSGSRHLGLEVAGYYQEEAWAQLNHSRSQDINAMIAELKAAGRTKEIPGEIRRVRSQARTNIPKSLAYVSGDLFNDYLHDMKLVQRFALLNRKAMMRVILDGLSMPVDGRLEQWTTIHNYIDTEEMILRKGAVSAKAGEKLLIPINMRDGSLVCRGLGNPDWNCSAPHGAGRVMSRQKAFKELSLEEYQASMQGIYSTSVGRDTLDESPMAYKTMDDIASNIGPTAEVLRVIKPVYNFKAAE